MAHSRSAKKRIRQTRKGTDINRARRNVLKTAAKRLLGAIETKSTTEAATLYKELQTKLDKTAQKGTIHKNKASRKKSRLAKRVNALMKQGGEAPKKA
jgi:small subunit ribosomal protein S20